MSATLTETLQRLHHSDSDEGVSMDMECHHNPQSQMFNYGYSSTGVSDIEEENYETDGPMATISEEHKHDGEDVCVYVALGKGETSMEALSWTLNNLATHSTILYLIHVFPQMKHIPNPLGIGMIPKSQVSAERVESYMAQERGKRRELLQKFLQSCSTSKIKSEEADSFSSNHLLGEDAKETLVLKKSRSRKGNDIVDQVLQNAPQSCKVRVICEGKEVNKKMMSLSPQAPTPRASVNVTSMTRKEEDQQNDSVSCICFKPQFK